MGIQNIVPYRLPNHKNKRLLDPHVVIVGAGASRAACKIDKNGKEVNASVNFINGHYIGMLMDEGDEIYRKDLVSTVIEKFKKSMAKGKVKDKLGY